ncbi:hypothetical protein LSM04_000476 [Trypanosoma melophagium]|uniref:uncharacterized protein n=1 Tax=Trypanosoma melophagium TaxID=715481 RepID=UPI00351A56AD|nr:hypothetical protein LSM04_000476 [Trypanosoma melophagium]
MSTYKLRLTSFYEKYIPNKVAQVDTQLEKYKGREEDFLFVLVQKYGPEPEGDTFIKEQPVDSGTHGAEEDFVLSCVADKGGQKLLRETAAELGVTVNSRETLLALETLLDTRTVMAVAATAVPETDAHIRRAFNESMYAPSTVQLASATVVPPSLEAFDFNSMWCTSDDGRGEVPRRTRITSSR